MNISKKAAKKIIAQNTQVFMGEEKFWTVFHPRGWEVFTAENQVNARRAFYRKFPTGYSIDKVRFATKSEIAEKFGFSSPLPY